MRTLLMTLALACLPAVARAQSVIRISGAPSCAACRIVADSMFPLGTVADSVRPTSFGNIERDRRGRFYALSDDHRVVVVFDPTGKMVGTIGRPGQGPGEFPGRLWSIRLGENDSLYVGAERQISIFDRDWRFIRRVSFPSQVHTFYPLPGGRFVGGMTIAADKQRRPFHVFNPDGTVLRSFGPDQPRPAGRGAPPRPMSERTVYSTTRFVLAADKQSIWAPASEFAMERWSLDGPLLQRYVIDAPWMQRGRMPELDSVVTGNMKRTFVRKSAPGADLAGLDAAGRFWFTGLIPLPGSTGTVDTPQPHSFRHEIIDFASRQVLASVPTTRYMSLIEGTDLAVSGVTDADGEVTLSVWRVGLRRP